jgi:CTP synthase
MSYLIFVTGGVMSSLGKGIAASSIGALLQARGFSIRMKKLDPYINVDPGTMSPFKHGEVFVMEDGCEADLDFGHYERFTGIACSADDSVTTGKIYETVINKERRGDYLGSDIQVIPHITTEIKNFITAGSENVDFTICEIGGTVGDIEGLPYIEALRQLSIELGKAKTICVHLTFVPFVKTAGELKTKPTQYSVKLLQSMGVQPDILLCRSEFELTDDAKNKLSMFCNIKRDNVITALDADSVYLIPEQHHIAGLDRQICSHFSIQCDREAEIDSIISKTWGALKHSIASPKSSVKIAAVGKYTKLKDAYISLTQALIHGGIANDTKVEIDWIDSEWPQEQLSAVLAGVSGILIPGGFSSRGTDGKLFAIQYAREKNIPFLGICLGLQLAVIESCRNILGIKTATSREFDDDGTFVIDFMEKWISESSTTETRTQDGNKGGTMRLGNQRCHISADSLAYKIYGKTDITERHRHRFEVNIEEYGETLERAGLVFSGMSSDGKLPEILERKDHIFFVATQAHPEFKSTPFSPHPLFTAFIKAALSLGR